jgi:hypothetical protein
LRIWSSSHFSLISKFPKEEKFIHISVNQKHWWSIWTWAEGDPSCTYKLGLLHTSKEIQAFRLILGTLYRLSSLPHSTVEYKQLIELETLQLRPSSRTAWAQKLVTLHCNQIWWLSAKFNSFEGTI